MPSRQCLGAALLLLLALAVVAPSSGQTVRGPANSQSMTGDRPDGERPSHRPIRSGLEEDLRPEDRLNERLASLRQLKQLLGEAEDVKLDDNFKQLAKQLLSDGKYKDLLKGLTPEDIARLKKRFASEGRDGLGSDPALRKLLKDSLKGTRLNDTDKDLLQRWAKKFTPGNGPEDGPGEGTGPDREEKKAPDGPPDRPPGPMTPPKPEGGAQAPPDDEGRSPWQDTLQRSNGWLEKNLDNWAGRVSKWMDTPGGQKWRDRLKDIGRRALEARTSLPDRWGEQTKGLVSWMPRLSDALPRTPSVPVARMPNVPSLGGMPAGPSISPASVAATGKVILGMALFAVVAAVAWRLAGAWVTARLATAAATWQLGPWPVRPEAVASRGDLVRAFEHLALLALGPVARTWNHLELGQRLGEQAALDADRRKEAANRLSHLYEQARYAPEQDPLPPHDLEVARRELCFLAGVPSA